MTSPDDRSSPEEDHGPGNIWKEGTETRPSTGVRTRPLIWSETEGSQSAPVDTRPWSQRPAPDLWRTDEGTDHPRVAVSVDGTDPEDGRSRRRRRWLIRSGLLLVVLAFVGDLAYSGYGAATELRKTSDHLHDAAAALREGSLDGAERSISAAASSGERARSYTRHPGLFAVASIPVLGGDAEVVRDLASAVGNITDAGTAAISGARELGLNEEGVATSLFDDGRVDFDAIEAAAPFVEEARSHLTEANEVLSDSPDPFLPKVQAALDEARLELATGKKSATKANLLLGTLPALFGEESPRRYLLAFQALGEARGTGGVIGMYGVLDVEGGVFELTEVAPYTDLFPGGVPVEPVDAPAWFEESYGGQLALRQWSQANLSPNFPAVSDVLLQLYTGRTGETLDGVIAMDPIALSHMMEGTGALTLDDYDQTISASQVADFLLRDAYAEYPGNNAQNRVLTALVQEFWTSVHEGEFDGTALTAGIAEAVRTQHLKIYTTEEDDQGVLTRVGAAGDYSTYSPNVQLVFNNNYSRNKIDYFLTRRINTVMRLAPTGEAIVSTKIELQNEAPEAKASPLFGEGNEGLAPGLNRMILGTLMPPGAELSRFAIDGEPRDGYIYDEGAHPVAWQLVRLEPGESAVVEVNYVMPGAARLVDGGMELSFTLYPQTVVNTDRFNFKIVAPPGYAISSDDPAVEIAGDTLTARGLLDQPRTFDLTLSSD